MKPILSKLICCILPALLVAGGYAQQVDSMMGLYAAKLPSEKIHIHFDKTVYNKTETVWYKIYLLQSGEAILDSKNVYVEWYDTEGKMITQTVSPLYLSTAKGSFTIPYGYKGESLRVRAYTKWMLNDDPAFHYEKELTVNVNPERTTARPPAPANRTKVEIFPEGGFLIQGLNSHIAFKATNQYGNPVYITGLVVNNSHKTLDTLITKHDGMGSFYISPSAQETYQLNWTDEYGSNGTTPIPITKTEGARMHIRVIDNKKVRFLIERTATAPLNFKRMFLLAHMNKVLFYKYDINASEKTIMDSELNVDSLPTGLLQFTLFTSDWVPVAERVVFINKHAYSFDATLTTPVINLNKRGKNVFEISVADTLLTNMSLSVTDGDLHPPDETSIYADILLKSEIKGKINNPAYYFSSDDENVTDHLDLVMLTNGWRRFDWDRIRTHTPPAITYAPETEYMKIRGKMANVTSQTSDILLNMFVYGKDSSKKMLFVPLEKNGSFEQDIVFYDTARIYYSINNKKYSTPKIQFDNGLMKTVTGKIGILNARPFSWTDSLAKSRLDVLLTEQELLRKKMAETTLQEVTVTARVKTKEQLLSDKYSTGFFTTGESGIFDLTDQNNVGVSSINVLEYLNGRVAGLFITLSGEDVRVRWRDDEPAYFLNEIQLPSKEQLTKLRMEQVAMVKVFHPLFMFATGSGRGGAICVYTKLGQDYKYPDLKGLENVKLSGYTRFKEFYNPTYEEPMMGFTGDDKRTTLYWNPELVTDGITPTTRVEFFNNDITTKFQVVLEGINSRGKMVRIVKMIDGQKKMN